MQIDPDAEQTFLDWEFFRKALGDQASDLHFCVGSPPVARVHGALKRYSGEALAAEDLENLLQLLADRQLRSLYHDENPQDLDYTIEFPNLHRRFRVNVFRQYNGMSIVMRVLADRIRTFEELGLPRQFEKLSFEKSGLVLVTGGTGAGKSTTLASMIELINRNQTRHIITIEDPIEIVFENKKALIEQRQIGTHVNDFSVALRSALREAPDVILVGEIRDSETARMALRAAQVGALVMATLHTRSAGETISRYLSSFEDNWRASARQQLADCLRGVLCQTLLLDKTGRQRVAACEVLLGTMAARHLIRDDRCHLLHSVMEISSQDGMVTLEQSLFRLVRDGRLDIQVAYENAIDKPAFLSQLPPEQQKDLQIEFETEIELKNLEKLKETTIRKVASRSI